MRVKSVADENNGSAPVTPGVTTPSGCARQFTNPHREHENESLPVEKKTLFSTRTRAPGNPDGLKETCAIPSPTSVEYAMTFGIVVGTGLGVSR